MSILDPKDDERERARDASLEVPMELKIIANALDEEFKQTVVISLVGKAGRAEHIVRSPSIREEVLFNARMETLCEEHKIKPADDWCLYCEEGNFFWCEYRLYGQKQACPEFTKSEREDTKKLTTPLGTAQQVAAGEKPAGRVDVKQDTQVKTGSGWMPLKETNPKPVTPVPLKPLTGAVSAPSSPVKTGFQAPTKSSLPYGLLYKCPKCWHWLESEDKLAIHFKWSCPEREGNTPETQTFLIPCKCCGSDFDAMVKSKKPPAAEGTDSKEADTK